MARKSHRCYSFTPISQTSNKPKYSTELTLVLFFFFFFFSILFLCCLFPPFPLPFVSTFFFVLDLVFLFIFFKERGGPELRPITDSCFTDPWCFSFSVTASEKKVSTRINCLNATRWVPLASCESFTTENSAQSMFLSVLFAPYHSETLRF